MKKSIPIVCIILLCTSCDPAQIQDVLGTLSGNNEPTSEEIGLGLKEALIFGISEGAEKLSAVDGYFKSPYKILLPEEARKVTDKLKAIPGFEQVENKITEMLNRAAEDAAQKAKPIFVSAIKQLTFRDALNILMGDQDAATRFLERTTYQPLYDEFYPVILESLNKFNAVEYWESLTTKYNSLPFVDQVDTRLDNYVTRGALTGLFAMVQKKEEGIRKNVAERTTPLLKKVFAKQDKPS